MSGENRGRGGRSGGGRDGSNQPRSRGPGPSQGAGRGGDQNVRGGVTSPASARTPQPASGNGLQDGQALRLAYANAAMIGKVVRVQMKTGDKLEWVEGLFHDWNLKSSEGIEVTLRMAHKEKDEKGFMHPQETLVVKAGTFVQMIADHIELNKDTRLRSSQGKFTDAEIGACSGVTITKELVPFQMDDSLDIRTTNLDAGGQGGTWDQFKVNQKLFGVETGYKEEYYTTELPKNLSEAEKKKAERIAAEIEREQKRAMGGKFRDETEAAEDDQGDEWASDVRNEDGTVRGSYHPQSTTAPSGEPKKSAWDLGAGGPKLADKLKTQNASEQAVMSNDPAIISTSVPNASVPSKDSHASTPPKQPTGAENPRYSAVLAATKAEKAQRKDLSTGGRGASQSGKGVLSASVQPLQPEMQKVPEAKKQDFEIFKKERTAPAQPREAQSKDMKQFSRDLKSPMVKPEATPSAESEQPAAVDLSAPAPPAPAKEAEAPKPTNLAAPKGVIKKTMFNIDAEEFVPTSQKASVGFGAHGRGIHFGGGAGGPPPEGGMMGGYGPPNEMGGGMMPPGGIGMGMPMNNMNRGMGPGAMMGDMMGMGQGMGMQNMQGNMQGFMPHMGQGRPGPHGAPHMPMPMQQGNFAAYQQGMPNPNMNMNIMPPNMMHPMAHQQNMFQGGMHNQAMMQQVGGGRAHQGGMPGSNNMRH